MVCVREQKNRRSVSHVVRRDSCDVRKTNCNIVILYRRRPDRRYSSGPTCIPDPRFAFAARGESRQCRGVVARGSGW